MTFVARLHAIPLLHANPRLRAIQHPAQSRAASPGRGAAMRAMGWTAAASLAALVAAHAFTHPSPEPPAFGCWSIPDDASACALGQAHAPTLKDQLVKLAASVLPEHDRRAALPQQDLVPRRSWTMPDPPASP